jgi:hypothetical protein
MTGITQFKRELPSASSFSYGRRCPPDAAGLLLTETRAFGFSSCEDTEYSNPTERCGRSEVLSFAHF